LIFPDNIGAKIVPCNPVFTFCRLYAWTRLYMRGNALFPAQYPSSGHSLQAEASGPVGQAFVLPIVHNAKSYFTGSTGSNLRRESVISRAMAHPGDLIPVRPSILPSLAIWVSTGMTS